MLQSNACWSSGEGIVDRRHLANKYQTNLYVAVQGVLDQREGIVDKRYLASKDQTNLL